MSRESDDIKRYAHLGQVKDNDLRKGEEYAIDGKIYIFDDWSTFWNYRMIEKYSKELHVFKRGQTIITKP